MCQKQCYKLRKIQTDNAVSAENIPDSYVEDETESEANVEEDKKCEEMSGSENDLLDDNVLLKDCIL